MFDLLLVFIVVFFMSFIGSASVSNDVIQKAALACSKNSGLKSINVDYAFSKKFYKAVCTDGLVAVLPQNSKSESSPLE